MDYVDYQKLAEQYASFLVAVGGVSITVLAIVLTLRPDAAKAPEPAEGDDRSFLVTALVVAALSCFVGAQMMAETAAFTNYTKPGTLYNFTEPVKSADFAGSKPFTRPTKKADRLFLLASSNIFIAIVLAFFALIFLPLSSRKVHHASIKPLSYLFFVILIGALYWAILAGLFRMRVPYMSVTDRWVPIGFGLSAGVIWLVSFWKLRILNRRLNSAEAKAKFLEMSPGILKRIISLLDKKISQSKQEFRQSKKKLSLLHKELSQSKQEFRSSIKKHILLKRRFTSLKRILSWLEKRLSQLEYRLFRLAIKLSFTDNGFLWATFAPSAMVTIISLGWFVIIYSTGDPNSLMYAHPEEAWFFCVFIAISYASLMVGGIEKMLGKQSTEE